MSIQEKEIAKTILEQLGGNRFIAMTGAKSFVALGQKEHLGGLLFMIPRSNNIRFVKITLNAMDLYDIEFTSAYGGKLSTISQEKDVYADNLACIFSKHTGLETNMPFVIFKKR